MVVSGHVGPGSSGEQLALLRAGRSHRSSPSALLHAPIYQVLFRYFSNDLGLLDWRGGH